MERYPLINLPTQEDVDACQSVRMSVKTSKQVVHALHGEDRLAAQDLYTLVCSLGVMDTGDGVFVRRQIARAMLDPDAPAGLLDSEMSRVIGILL